MVDLFIDALTNCLVVSATDEEVKTHYKIIERTITKADVEEMHKEGWQSNFDWKKVQDEGNEIAELYVEGDDRVQGLIGFKHIKRDLYTFVPLAESAPWNIGSGGEYMGVGGHLFAIACKESWDVGNEGYVVFESKTDLVEHYIENLHAQIIGNGTPVRMMLDPYAALHLIKKYILGGKE